MTDELLPPGWFLQPQNWPYWMPNTLLGTLQPLVRPRDPGSEFGSPDLQPSFGSNGEAASAQINIRSGAAAWPDSVSPHANGRILGSLIRAGDRHQSLLSRAQSPAPLTGSAGILAPLTPANGFVRQNAPVWQPSISQLTSELDPARQAWWTLPSPRERAGDPAETQTSGSRPIGDVLSDSDPQELVAGARYAQLPPRRGRGRPGGWEPSPAESIRLLLYANAHRTLRELDPKNPQLQSLSSPTWIPSQSDIARLHEEIARMRREQGLSELELHHTLPRQFAPEFGKAGIDPENYKTYMPRDQHRLLPKGLHTGTDNWNARWKRFFNENENARSKQILELLNDMLSKLFR